MLRLFSWLTALSLLVIAPISYAQTSPIQIAIDKAAATQSTNTAGLAEAVTATFEQQAKLTAADAAEGDQFGYSVSLSGDRALVGARGDDDNGDASGSAYVFAFDGTKPAGSQWVQEAKLTASDAARSDNFGYSVSLSGDRALVGAAFDNGVGSASGAAYIFELASCGTACTETQKLTASDATQGDRFGFSVSLSDDRALIGAWGQNGFTGSAYAFAFDGEQPVGAQWVQQAKLTASDGAVNDWFGYSVSLSGDRALIGAHFGDDAGVDSGSAYVFELASCGIACNETQKLTAADAAAEDEFGWSVSLLGNRALVGAIFDDDAGLDSGSAYVFAFDGTKPAGSQWVQKAKLTASDATPGDEFGRSVSLSGDRALVGAIFDDDAGLDSGSAYVFAFDGTQPIGSQWSQKAKLTASDGTTPDRFGWSVSLSGDRTLIGAHFSDGAGLGSGSAYVFAILAPEPLACAVGTGLSFIENGPFDADGNPDGEVVSIFNLSPVPTATAGCTLGLFDPLTETLTYSQNLLEGVIPGAGDGVLNGVIYGPLPNVIPDGPGAVVLLEGSVADGATVPDVLPQLVSGMVYRAEDDILAIYTSYAEAAASSEAFLSALASLSQPVASEDEATGALALTVAPNPVVGHGTVTFELAKAADVTVVLYDALGREVARLAEGPYAAGRHTLELATADLPTGVYVVRAQFGDTVRTARLTVVR